MEDFRHLSRVAEIHGHRPLVLERGHRRPGLHLNPGRLLLSFTAIVLGMFAWWGQ